MPDNRYCHGGEIYDDNIKLDFSISINPLGIPNEVKDTIRNSLDMLEVYPDSGCRKLRELIAKEEGAGGDEIIVGNGSCELIYAYANFVKPKSAVIVCPAFSEYENALNNVCCRIDHYICKVENDFRIRDDFLLYIEQRKPEVIFISNPANPTGVLTDEEQIKDIAAFCASNGIRLFLDECFIELSGGRSAATYLEDFENVFILKAFTKTYAMAGIRLGYGICRDYGFISGMRKILQPWNVSGIAQAAGDCIYKMSGKDEYLSKSLSLIEKERKQITEKLESLGARTFKSGANYILFYIDGDDLKDFLKQRGILIRDCRNFEGLKEGYYRVAVKRPEENEQLLENIEEYCKWQKR